MAKVLGIGGVFFKAQQPEKLSEWYAQHLGIKLEKTFNGAVFHHKELADNAYAVWSPFKQDSDYFQPSNNDYMINFIVDDVDGLISNLKKANAKVIGDTEDSELGKFAWVCDPEGNKIELWQPKQSTQ